MSDTATKDIDPNRGQPDSVPEPGPESKPESEPDNEPDEIVEDDCAKSFVCELKADHDEPFFQATITTETVDREGDVVLAKGLDFQNFLKNPVVLLGHPFGMDGPFDMPIGKAKWIKAKGRKVVAEITPAPTELGQEVFDLIKGGFLGAVSIGFQSIESSPPTEKELRSRPEWASARRVFRKAELVEFSVVNVPANPDALITAVRKGHLSVRPETLEHFGLPAVKMIRCKNIKRVHIVKRSPMVRPAGLDAKAVRRIARNVAATTRGRMVTV